MKLSGKNKVSLIVASIAAVGGIIAALVAGLGGSSGGTTVNNSHNFKICTNGTTCGEGGATVGAGVPSQTGSASPPVSIVSPLPSGSASLGKLYQEEAYNHLGTDVFSDPEGASASGPPQIPFGTYVMVKCYSLNESSMPSINDFYLVETAPWANEYAPANTFLNADTSKTLDPDVPKC
jgi:hypothetical protein